MKNCALVITLNGKPKCLLTDQVSTVQQQLNEQVILLHNLQDPHSCVHQDFILLGPIPCIVVDMYYHFGQICCHRFQGRSVRHTWNNCTDTHRVTRTVGVCHSIWTTAQTHTGWPGLRVCAIQYEPLTMKRAVLKSQMLNKDSSKRMEDKGGLKMTKQIE